MICKRKLLNLLLLATCILLLATVVYAETVEYVYDDAGRLIRAQYRDGGTVTKVIDYYYDEVGNRTRKAVGLPNISVTPTSYDFGSVAVGNSSSPASFTVTNNGNIDIAIDDILDVGEFAVQSDLCLGQPLTPSMTCTFEVVFTPLSAGPKAETLVVPSDDPNTPNLNVDLRGNDITFLLNVVKSGSGVGTVTSDLPGIDCGVDCDELYAPDTVVTLTAVPSKGRDVLN
jgi:hypothetical protein